MPRGKPQGWPKLMVERRLRSGSIGYYWVPPTWALKAGSPKGEPLGSDYGEAKRRCDDILNPQYDAWRTRGETSPQRDGPAHGTFDWMAALYKTSPKYNEKPPKTRKSYDAALKLVSQHRLKDGRTFGMLSLRSITPGAADRIYVKLKVRADGSERVRTAILAMAICKRAWNVARRDKPEHVPLENPFAKMDLEYAAKPTRPFTFPELMRFVAAADAAGEVSIGTAAMIAYFWLQR